MPDTLAEALEHHKAGRLPEAERLYRAVLEGDPEQADALGLLGVLACQSGRRSEAVECLERAVRLRPGAPAIHNNFGLALQAAGCAAKAAAAFREALRLDPRYPEAHNNLGTLLLNLGQAGAAAACFRAALELRPGYAEAHGNLGNARQASLAFREAAACYREALRLEPRNARAWNNLGGALQAQGRPEEAEACYRRAVALEPGYHRAGLNLLCCLHYREMDPAALFAEHRAWAARLPSAPLPPPAPRGRRRLRVGYLSPDFRRHSVAFFFEPVLAAHDRAAFEIFCYADVTRPDAVTTRLRAQAEHWRDVSALTDAEAASAIRADALDILVDLAGHTAGNRLPVFASRPAPAAAAWLGYPDTTGLDAVDARITDAIADPPGAGEHLHSERLVRLPAGFLCYRPPEEAPETGGAPARREIVFACFNELAKLSPETVRVWCDILERTPGSRLLLKARALADDTVREEIAARFAGWGIPRRRVELRGPAESLAAHLAEYLRADIALDPFPYAGTTTTCEALWMGVPVISLAGRGHASRAGASVLHAAGVPELAAATSAAYADAAVALAADGALLSEYRRGLRPTMARSPLTAAAQFTRSLEAAYGDMAWRNGS